MRQLTSILKRFRPIDSIEARVESIQEALGRIEARQIADQNPISLRKVEFRVFSQWGEDGIIQYLIQRVPIERKIFVEFGVEHYAEANTRFLLVNDNWTGFISTVMRPILNGSVRNKFTGGTI